MTSRAGARGQAPAAESERQPRSQGSPAPRISVSAHLPRKLARMVTFRDLWRGDDDDDDDDDDWSQPSEARLDDEQFKSGVREILLYLLFMCLFSFVAMAGNRLVQYRLQARLDAHIFGAAASDPEEAGSFADVATVDEMWSWLDEQFVERIWGDGLAEHEASEGERAFILHDSNLLLGSVRLRQQRVRAVSATECRVPRALRTHVPRCHFDLAPDTRLDEPTTPAGLLTTLTLNPLAARTEIRAELRRLQRRGWVDAATRLVRLDLTLYNANYDMFVSVVVQFAIEASGGVWPTRWLRPMWLRRSLMLVRGTAEFQPDAGEVLLLSCEFGCIVMILYYSARTLVEIRRDGIVPYFSHAWSIIHVANSLLFWAAYTLRVRALIAVHHVVNLNPGPSEFVDFESLGAMQYGVHYLNAVNLVLVYLKLFKYLRLSTRLSLLVMTLERASTDLATFTAVFSLIVFAFTLAFHATFGSVLRQYADVPSTFLTLMKMAFGDFDYTSIAQANHVLAPILFLSYMVAMILILINVFLAIVNESYIAVRRHVAQEDEFIIRMRHGLAKRVERVKATRGYRFVASNLAVVAGVTKKSKQALQGASRKGSIVAHALAAQALKKRRDGTLRADTNGDGRLDAAEIDAYLGDEIAEGAAAELVRTLDRDGDGSLSEDELRAAAARASARGLSPDALALGSLRPPDVASDGSGRVSGASDARASAAAVDEVVTRLDRLERQQEQLLHLLAQIVSAEMRGARRNRRGSANGGGSGGGSFSRSGSRHRLGADDSPPSQSPGRARTTGPTLPRRVSAPTTHGTHAPTPAAGAQPAGAGASSAPNALRSGLSESSHSPLKAAHRAGAAAGGPRRGGPGVPPPDAATHAHARSQHDALAATGQSGPGARSSAAVAALAGFSLPRRSSQPGVSTGEGSDAPRRAPAPAAEGAVSAAAPRVPS